MTPDRLLTKERDAAFVLRMTLHGIVEEISAMSKATEDAEARCEFNHLEAVIEIALSRHANAIKYGDSLVSRVEEGWRSDVEGYFCDGD